VTLESFSALTAADPPFSTSTTVLTAPGSFTTPSWKPLVSGVSATPGKLQMTLHATINGQGTATHYHFEYGPTTAYGSSFPVPDEASGSGTAEVTKTTPGEIEGYYHYRVAATNEEGTTYSPDQEVYVQERPTIAASEVRTHIGETATVTATINPHGKESTYFVEYGPTSSYGSKTTVQNAGGGPSPVPVKPVLSGLEYGRNYHARIVSENWAGTRLGPDMTFTAGWGSSAIGVPGGGVPHLDTRYEDVSCSSSARCVAVGFEGSPAGSAERAVAAEWDGAHWVSEAVPGSAEMRQDHPMAIGCSGAACEVIGYEVVGETQRFEPVVLRRNGPGQWERQHFETPAGDVIAWLVGGVECFSASNCIAVVTVRIPSGEGRGVAERWNGSKWQAELLPAVPGAVQGFFNGLSCTSPTSCTAVGATYTNSEPRGLYAERLSGSTWMAETLPFPSPGKILYADHAVDVSCPTSSYCEVVTAYEDGEKSKRLFAERWTGSTWSTQSLPNPEGGPRFELPPPAVGCQSPTSCVVVGGSTEAEGSQPYTYKHWQPYAVRWNGTAWERQILPEPANFWGGSLSTIACPEPTACVAAGRWEEVLGEQSEHKGLVEAFIKSPTPTASTGTAREVSASSAKLAGTADPNWTHGHAFFEYGPTTAYGTATPEFALGAEEAEEEVAQTVSGLQKSTAYHFRIVVTGGGHTVAGQDQTFETGGAPHTQTAAWSFDEGKGTTAADATGDGHTGTVSGAEWTTGKFGAALAFNGKTGCVSVPVNSELEPTGEFTIEAWVRPVHSETEPEPVIAFQDPEAWKRGEEQFAYELLAGGDGAPKAWARKAEEGGGYVGVYGSTPLPEGAWAHLALTDDDSVLRLYVDGEVVDTGTAPHHLGTAAGPLTIGCDTWGGTFDGTIDEVRVHDKALSPAELAEDEGTPLGSVRRPPVAAYSLDEGKGTTVHDATGDGHEGTIQGSPTWTTGKFGGALRFARGGTEQCVNIPDSTALHLAHGFTLEAWVRPEGFVGEDPIIFKQAAPGYGLSYSMGIGFTHAGRLEGYTEEESIYSPETIKEAVWTHVAYTYDGQDLRLFVNGEQVSERLVGEEELDGTGYLQIGCAGPESGYHTQFEGAIDEARVYNHALSKAEIAEDEAASIASRGN
jgi:hypothetical protein